MTAFASPQCQLLLDDLGARVYGNVDNMLEVTKKRGRPYSVPVVVATKIFHIMQDVLNIPADARVSLYLDQLPSGMYVFGLWVTLPSGDREMCDLWEVGESQMDKRILE